ncbi:MAG: DUF4276 family protein [Fimbriiglobus sp.]
MSFTRLPTCIEWTTSISTKPTSHDKIGSKRRGNEMPLRVVVLVEGHGEDGAIRGLLERIWYSICTTDTIDVIPWRCKQGDMLNPDKFKKLIEASAIKLLANSSSDLTRLLLVMVDSEGNHCPKTKSAELLAWACEARADLAKDIACVLPNVMFETWFAASAESLRGWKNLPADLPKSADPEGEGLGKPWIKKHLPRKYKETVDQPSFVSQMSLEECAVSSRSFRKLLSVLRSRLPVVSLDPPAVGDETTAH